MSSVKPEFCQHCGARLTGRYETLSKALCMVLIKAYVKARLKGKNSLHLQTDLPDLDKNEYNNFQKLRYFGLVMKNPNESNEWQITKKGVGFLKGETDCAFKVYVFRNEVQRSEPEMVTIRQQMETNDTYWLR